MPTPSSTEKAYAELAARPEASKVASGSSVKSNIKRLKVLLSYTLKISYYIQTIINVYSESKTKPKRGDTFTTF